MAAVHDVTIASRYNGENVTGTVSIVADGMTSLDVTVPGSTTDQAASVSILTAKVKSLYMLSSVDLTVQTNNGTTPDNTFTLKAGVPYFWDGQSGYFSNPLSANITTLYLTNAGTTAASFKLRAAQNA